MFRKRARKPDLEREGRGLVWPIVRGHYPGPRCQTRFCGRMFRRVVVNPGTCVVFERSLAFYPSFALNNYQSETSHHAEVDHNQLKMTSLKQVSKYSTIRA
jgi:hypothetical protein